MSVREYLDEVVSKERAVHLTLIDPDEQSPQEAGEMAFFSEEAGTDAFMVGGSTRAGGNILDSTIKEMKDNSDLPIILFPSNEGAVSREADAIFFMSLLNSRDPFYISGAQMRGAPIVKKFGLEPISLAYLIVEPGGTAGKVGKVDLISRDDPETAVAYSLSSKYLGMESIYLEAGSGAENPVPVEMIQAVRSKVDSLIVVGGGIREPELAAERVAVGADVIVTGTLVEQAGDKYEAISALIEAIKK